MFCFFVSAVLLVFALKYRYPYFIKEAKYIYRVALVRYRLTKYIKSKPFYSLLDRFLDSVRKSPHNDTKRSFGFRIKRTRMCSRINRVIKSRGVC